MTEIRWYEEGKPHMRIKENKGVTWLSYQAFEQFPDIVHGQNSAESPGGLR